MTRGSSLIGRVARHTIALTAVAALVAGCSTGAPPSAGGPTPGASSTPRGAPAPAAGNGAIPGCPNYVEVVETGPVPSDNGAENGPVAQEQNRLTGDVEVAQGYGASHADEFTSVRFENGPRVRIVVAFTGHLAEHCAALRELLAFPEEFELVLEKRTEVELLAIQQEIVDFARPVFVSAGSGGAAGVIEVALRADGEAMARQIVERYGDAVNVTVGLLSYPDGTRADGLTTCMPATGPLRVDAPLRGTLVLEPGGVSSGAGFNAKVQVANVGTEDFDFQSGAPATALVFAPSGTEAIGTFTGGIGGVGLGQVLRPLESIDIDVLGGTASCDPALGYALPPGRYEARAVIDVLTMHDNAPTDIGYILSDPAPLTIVP